MRSLLATALSLVGAAAFGAVMPQQPCATLPASINVPPMAMSPYADTEVSTNVSFIASGENSRGIEMHFAIDRCMSNCVQVAFGNDADGDGDIDNDAACEMLARVAVSHARAGADGVAPSAMMDGQIAAIREALDEEGFKKTLLISYSTKFASTMYGPFRDAENSAPSKGDRQGYQASYRDPGTALRESMVDEAEGADVLMVKPALWYLDMISKVREHTLLPVMAYNVSGEYAMVHDAAKMGHCDLYAAARESLYAIFRAGASQVISYWTPFYDDIFPA